MEKVNVIQLIVSPISPDFIPLIHTIPVSTMPEDIRDELVKHARKSWSRNMSEDAYTPPYYDRDEEEGPHIKRESKEGGVRLYRIIPSHYKSAIVVFQTNGETCSTSTYDLRRDDGIIYCIDKCVSHVIKDVVKDSLPYTIDKLRLQETIKKRKEENRENDIKNFQLMEHILVLSSA